MSVLNPSIIRSRVESVLWHAGNPAPNTGGSTWTPRHTDMRAITLGHGELGVLDQALMIHHTLKTSGGADVTLSWSLRTMLDLTSTPLAITKNGPVVAGGLVPSDGRWFILPERGEGVQTTPTQDVIACTALRSPAFRFQLELTADLLPATGEVYLRTVRRY